MSVAAPGRPARTAAARIAARAPGSRRSRPISAASWRGRGAYTPAPAPVTNSALPFSWPGTNEVSTSGAPQQVASAIVPGPALPTTMSAQRSQSAMLPTKPCAVSRPPAGPPGEPGHAPVEEAVAAADDRDLDVVHLAENRGGAAAQPAAAFRAPGQHHEEVTVHAEFALEFLALGLVERRLAELGGDRQPEWHVAVGRHPVLRAPVGDLLRRHDDPVDRGVPPGQVRGDQVGDDGDDGRQGACEVTRAHRRVGGHRVERDDERRAAGLGGPGDAAVHRGHDRAAHRARAPAVSRSPARTATTARGSAGCRARRARRTSAAGGARPGRAAGRR